MDIASIIGLVLGITALVGGAFLEGLHLETFVPADEITRDAMRG